MLRDEARGLSPCRSRLTTLHPHRPRQQQQALREVICTFAPGRRASQGFQVRCHGRIEKHPCSLALLRLCEPWRERLTLIWANTGHAFPHMADFVRSHAPRFNLVEVTAERSLADHWAEYRMPVDLLPLDHVAGMDWREPRLQAWTACCLANRTGPVIGYVERLPEPVALICGTRRNDQGATVEGMKAWRLSRAEHAMPLWTWTTADVLAFVEAEGIALALHHDTVPTSLECLVCPANLSAEKLALIDRLHPKEGVAVRARARAALAHAAAKANEIIDVIDGTGRAAREVRI